jgi:biotin carboxylase
MSTSRGAPIVIKADGLAAGKGVVVATSVAEAKAAIDQMLVQNKLGNAGARVVVEEFLDGEEASFIVMADGAHALPLAHQPGPQAPARTATRARNTGAWRLLARSRGDAAAACAA